MSSELTDHDASAPVAALEAVQAAAAAADGAGEVPTAARSYRRELFFNQLWQGLNFVSKAAFLAILTPLMLHTWGAAAYGMFALASSLLVSLAILDCGIRSLTRLRLCEAQANGDRPAFTLAVAEGAAAFVLVALLAFLGAVAIAVAHGWSRWLQLPPEGDFLIAMTVGLVGLFMCSVLLLEPLAAQGRVSTLKIANTLGALAALPVVGALVYFGGTVTEATLAYFVCLTTPNLVLLAALYREGLIHLRDFAGLRWANLASTWRAGGWFYVTTLALIAKTHALTFVVSALMGPAAAGTFYILLRITEIVGGWGATASDTSLASLANERTAQGRAENFNHSYRYALIFCVYGTVALGFLTPMILARWLPGQASHVTSAIAWAMAFYGLSGAFSKVVVNAAMGTGLVSQAAVGNLIEAVLVLVAGILFQVYLGLTGLFLGATLAAVSLFPAASRLAGNFGESATKTWLQPLVPQIAPLTACALALGAAWWFNQVGFAIVAVAMVAGVVVYQLRQLHR